ncbi:MAG: hypothetical protein ACUVVU_05435 [Tepidimonas sp.]
MTLTDRITRYGGLSTRAAPRGEVLVRASRAPTRLIADSPD